ncbi:hypothetical protein N7499_001578 [Penicillium canescens]|uniref:PQ loop repeat protein n=1 Tax=Penicillium canescens TaxID=5083 RepID=A0AAD6N6A6_PENCN|nr:uncharacterized protein N7446_009121 [Penicillium canescens]KAJ6034372.1 hypothetical protein N7460_008547 [Penicillium canescens]KAJ6053109.1 hypothetical protein N7446_009121 [Penicillium canescens]KAJ6097204.1 hypothetical protein N7499_001578 [Penicillium canescens]
MYLISAAIDWAAPVFLVTSPSRPTPTKSVFYWFGEYYSATLLTQAVVMIVVQMTMLKVALDNRPSPGGLNGIEHAPFSGGSDSGSSRPYEFWQWKNTKPYYMFLTYFVGALTLIHLSPISQFESYISLLGYIGLAVEATLPIPQIIANYRSGSCKGFRVSVIAAWILGDTMKMSYFFCSTETIPWAFKLCGMFQCACDFYLGFQFYMFTRGSSLPSHSRGPSQTAGRSEQDGRWGHEAKDIRMN